MATVNYTSLLGLALPTTGDLSGTWGNEVNTAITSLLDTAVAGTTTLSTDADVTLTTTNGVANEARSAIIRWTASGTVTRNITAPAQSKAYAVINATGSTQSIVVRGAGSPPTTGVTLVAGEKAIVAWNGSDFVKAASTVITNLTGVLTAANGGTGLSSSGANGNVLTSNGTTWTSAALPAGGLTYVYKTANYNVANKEGVLANTSGGAFTVTLPATPSVGDQVVVADAGAAWGTNNLTVGRNGSTIGDLAQDLVCDITGASVQLVYDGTTWEVYAQIGGNGGNAATQPGNNAFTGANTFFNATGQTFAQATANDGIVIQGRAGGSSSYRATFTTATLSASRTVTLPDANTTIPVATQVLTFSGPTAARTITLPDENFTVGFRNLPAVGTKTSSYTLAVGDVGKYVQVGTSGSITIPTSTFAEGDAITLYNNTTGNITITCSAPTAYIAGTNTVKTSMTLATRGVATILFYSATACVVSGNVT